MTSLLVLFLNNLLPIFLAAGAGYLLSRQMELDPRVFSRVIFYIFSPCLIFSLLTENRVDSGEVAQIMLFAFVTTLLIGVVTWLAGQMLRFDRRTLAALLLSTMFMNAGNFGLSLILFAYDENTMAIASLFFVTIAMMVYTFGVFIASMGSASIFRSLLNLLKIPAVYAVALAAVFLQAGIKPPPFLERTTSLLAQAAIPAMLVLLGMQIRQVNWSGFFRPLLVANVIRLLLAPAIAVAISLFFGLQGNVRQAGILEAAMPTAVVTTVLATEFDVEPSLVTAIVFTTTIFSAFTLTPLLAYLGV